MTSLFFRALAYSGDLSPQNGPNCRGLERSPPVPPLLVSSRAFFVTMAPRLGAHNKPNNSQYGPFFMDPTMLSVLGRADTFHLCLVMSLDFAGRAMINKKQMTHEFFVESVQGSLAKLTQLENLFVIAGVTGPVAVSVPEVGSRFEYLFKQLIPASRIASTLQRLEIAWHRLDPTFCDSTLAPTLSQLVSLSSLDIGVITAAVLRALAAGPGKRLRRLHGDLCTTTSTRAAHRARTEAFASFVNRCSEVRVLLLSRFYGLSGDDRAAPGGESNDGPCTQSICALALQLPYLQHLELDGCNIVVGSDDNDVSNSEDLLGRIIAGGVASNCLTKMRISEASQTCVLDRLTAAAIASVGNELEQLTVLFTNPIPQASLAVLLNKDHYSKLTSLILGTESHAAHGDDDDNSHGRPLSLPPTLTHLYLSGMTLSPRQVTELLTDLPRLKDIGMTNLQCSESSTPPTAKQCCSGDCWLDRLVQCPIRELALSCSFGAQQLSAHLAGTNGVNSQPFRETLTDVSLVQLEQWQGGADREDLVAAIVKYCVHLQELQVYCDDIVTMTVSRALAEFNCGSTLRSVYLDATVDDLSLKPVVDALLSMTGGSGFVTLHLNCTSRSSDKYLVFSQRECELLLAKFKNLGIIGNVDERDEKELKEKWPDVQWIAVAIADDDEAEA